MPNEGTELAKDAAEFAWSKAAKALERATPSTAFKAFTKALFAILIADVAIDRLIFAVLYAALAVSKADAAESDASVAAVIAEVSCVDTVAGVTVASVFAKKLAISLVVGTIEDALFKFAFKASVPI